uniref:Uncharacterized protein n=1 Tax=Candidatus Kentrum sp. MB TaxID=2138164 RepID=A0A451BE54_9GAMM|nr:MAG: hypothetical protein BECKMB1821G_GA0114241_105811 [Candidatus Kentron sp. MB]VFK32789.1 MAG: hypothetical protein BECKMB1821I_GA0114274_103624 [Candidatus Kentron sp. MB]VFK76546.1 MAG: hypothetical protein BECKMB1821H_GA0114242_106211 [Candidatus Kentron sp. MB]
MNENKIENKLRIGKLRIGDILQIIVIIIATFTLVFQIKGYKVQIEGYQKEQRKINEEQNRLLEEIVSFKDLKGRKLVVGEELIIGQASGVSIKLLGVNQPEKGLAKLHIKGEHMFDEIVKEKQLVSVNSKNRIVKYEFRILDISQENDWIRIHIQDIPLSKLGT